MMLPLYCSISLKSNGGYSEGVPPLTIPNREVKPLSADGTTREGGRVGRCRFFISISLIGIQSCQAFFYCFPAR